MVWSFAKDIEQKVEITLEEIKHKFGIASHLNKNKMNISKEVAGLRKIYDKLQKKFKKEQYKLEQREQYFEERSEKWQESEKGLDFEANSSILGSDLENFEQELSNLDDVITEIASIGESAFDSIS